MKPLLILGLAAGFVGGGALAAPEVLRAPLESSRRAAPSGRATTGGAGGAAAAGIAQEELPYDGRYTFVRVRFGEGNSGGLSNFGFRRRGGRGAVWAHDYPRADLNFLKILQETTTIDLYEGGRVLSMDDPAVFDYPALYVVEVGYWDASDQEVEALGQYLQKGGFLIVDDFRDRQLWNIRDILQRAVPGAALREVPDDHDIFDSFFRIEEPRSLQSYGWEPPTYLGLYESADPQGRLMAILNYNGDIAEYWEYSDYQYLPIDLTNEAYKFGVNYVVYAMTH